MMIPKPADTHWTDDQWKAISLYDQNLLIAAAAGSGKTAVLVERIIRRISAENDPIDVDRLLVATFTKAAADEMRQRIREALEQKLLQTPDSQHLRRQLALIHRASITTLHSFCLEVVQRYFQVVQIDPGFRIGNETEMELMRQDALEELFEEYYADSDEGSDFWKLVDAYSGERSDDALYKLVLQLYDYSRSHPWPDHWLLEMAETFDQSQEALPVEVEAPSKQDNIWYQSLLEDVRLELAGALGLLNEAVQLSGQPDGPDAYLETLQEDLTLVEHLYDVSYEQSWGHVYQAFQALDFARLKAAKGDYINKDVQEKVKGLRDMVKKQLLGLKEECFERSPETFIEEMQSMAPLMKTLVQLVIAFSNRYRETKAAKSLVDFSDLEHYCLQILRHSDSTPDELKPSQAATDYQNQFVEVLLDEYQDTNRVQEAIVSLISKQSPGNRFMVGDVKQSIYRFRLAEPALFLQKYKSYRDDDGEINSEMDGRKIDLAQNFRSRSEVVDGVNFIFKQMMQESVGEIAYDTKAALVSGADYPDLDDQGVSDCSIELMLIDKASSINDDEGYAGEEDAADDGQNTGDESINNARDLETVQMEARLMASQIKRLMGREGMPFQVFDKKIEGTRPITYRDIVILLRATQHWAPIIMDEFRQAGIPCYADLNTGYFSAGEIEIILSLLRVIDNPLQEIALAAVLRSPIYQLSAEDLAQIRIPSKGESFYQAVLNYAKTEEVYNATLQNKLKQFLEQLECWRTEARQGSLSELIWEIYRETGYFDLVGGMAGGTQRQANLRALYDRARQYEATSFRGLFRFLRFIERMKDSGGDLGTARALGEQEDVVRIMSIHKSKGLEFPVVFVAGLSKMFNRMDLNGNFLMHKQLGFGPKFIDTELRVSYPTLPSIAIKKRMRMEMLAEEMRVLYVALTRAKEKLFLLGTVKSLEKQLQTWGSSLDCLEWELPDYSLAKASCYMDWLGPALIRHPQAEGLRNRMNIGGSIGKILSEDSSRWKVSVVPSDGFDQAAAAQEDRDISVLNAIANTDTIDEQATNRQAELIERLQWQYPYKQAETYFSKTSVSEMKRIEGIEKMQRIVDHEEAAADSLLGESVTFHNALLRRPRFMEEKKMTPTERGTLYHAVMQYIPIQQNLSSEMIVQSINEMMDKQLLTVEQSKSIDVSMIESFFESELGAKMLSSGQVNREIPFSFGIPAGDVYPEADEHTADEVVMIQGVIDCLFEVEDGLILLDYKTDAVYGNQIEDIRERYRLQMDIYAKAVESIWKQPVKEKVLFLFDGGHIVSM